jgi:hypothetical protein
MKFIQYQILDFGLFWLDSGFGGAWFSAGERVLTSLEMIFPSSTRLLFSFSIWKWDFDSLWNTSWFQRNYSFHLSLENKNLIHSVSLSISVGQLISLVNGKCKLIHLNWPSSNYSYFAERVHDSTLLNCSLLRRCSLWSALI